MEYVFPVSIILVVTLLMMDGFWRNIKLSLMKESFHFINHDDVIIYKKSIKHLPKSGRDSHQSYKILIIVLVRTIIEQNSKMSFLLVL